MLQKPPQNYILNFGIIKNRYLKENYFYIDESGGIDTNSNFFILGCYKTDTPELLRTSLNKLKNEILESPYFAPQRKKFQKEGFHACDNHPDIRAKFYNLVSTLNIRAYILLFDKRSEIFRSLKETISSNEIYNICIQKLLKDRLIKNRQDRNHFIFEQYGNKVNNWIENVNSVISTMVLDIDNNFNIDCQYDVVVHDKSDINLSIIDYLNYIFNHCFEQEKPWRRMFENFSIIEPKIGLIYKMDRDLFFDKNKRFNLKNY